MISSRLFTNALAATLAAGTGKPVGRGRRPDGDPDHYYILYRLPRQTDGAPVTDLNEDATITYQITCVSAKDTGLPGSFGTQDQLEWLEDKAREVVLGRHPVTRRWLHDITADGIRVLARRPDVEAGGTPDPTDGIMSSASRFVFDLSST